jgi:arylsulfatase A-like enzyme
MPALDRLAATSHDFRNNFVTTSICPVSRASILTGQHMSRHGIKDFSTPLSEKAFTLTYPYLMRKAGYHMGFVGKWGLGGELPHTQYDFWAGYAGQGNYNQGKLGHLTDVQTQQTLKFLAQVPDDRPWCLQLSYKAPHGPLEPKKDLEHIYDNIVFPRAKTDTVEALEALPLLIQRGPSRYQGMANDEGYQDTFRKYYALLRGINDSVEVILSALEASGALDNTVVIFTSDNGLMLGEHRMRGKWYMFEESIRTPMFIRMPKQQAAHKISGLALNIDVAPTVLALAGVDTPHAMQGKSLLPMMSAENTKIRDRFYYEHTEMEKANILYCQGVRTEKWKYSVYSNKLEKAELLFDIENDPLEETNMIDAPEAVDIRQQLRQQTDELGKAVRVTS